MVTERDLIAEDPWSERTKALSRFRLAIRTTRLFSSEVQPIQIAFQFRQTQQVEGAGSDVFDQSQSQ